jgi:hypothetical protein
MLLINVKRLEMGPANYKWVQYHFQRNVWDLKHSIKWDK